MNKLQRDYDEDKISPEKLEWHMAGEYYLWTSLWYAALFTGVYALGGQYKNNAKILLTIVAGGLVIGSVQKNIQINKDIRAKKQGKNT